MHIFFCKYTQTHTHTTQLALEDDDDEIDLDALNNAMGGQLTGAEDDDEDEVCSAAVLRDA